MQRDNLQKKMQFYLSLNTDLSVIKPMMQVPYDIKTNANFDASLLSRSNLLETHPKQSERSSKRLNCNFMSAE